MIECGFAHDELMAMDEEEFCYWRDTRIEYDRLVKEASDREIERQRGKGNGAT